MAMLSEPRQRKRYNLVPKGKALFEDSERFGTKMLAKMGWSKGKGLGANEDGQQEFVRIRYKNDANGLGFEDRDDQWTEHEKHFNGLLENLKSKDCSTGEDVEVVTPSVGLGFVSSTKGKLKDKFSGQSLEEKSKNSKARVHYKKFTKGKDMSQYSEKDLANIFGKKATPDSTNIYDQFQAYNAADEKKTDNASEKTKFELGCQTTNTGVSVSDYFKLKMDALKAKRKEVTSETNENEVRGIENENIITTNEKTIEKQTESEDLRQGSEDETGGKIPAKKKKNKRKEKTEVSDNHAEEDSQITGENIQSKNNYKEQSDPCEIDPEREEEFPAKRKNKQRNPDDLVQESEETNKEVQLQEKNGKKKDKKHITLKSNRPVSERFEENLVFSQKEASPTLQENILNKRKQKDYLEANNSYKENKTSKKLDTKEIIGTLCFESLKDEDELKAKKAKKRIADEVGDSPKTNQVRRKKSKNNPDDTIKNNSTVSQLLSRPVEKQNKKKKNEPISSVEVSQPQVNSHLESNSLIDTYKISTFCAEKFRTADLQQYKGSTIYQINGYGLSENLKLQIVEIPSDKERILKLWNGVMDKYQNADPKQKIYNKYRRKVQKAKRAKTGIPKIKTKCLKRRQIFQPL